MLFDKLTQRGRDFLGVKYPLIAGAMTWISDYNLVEAVSDNGAFPVLAGGNMPPDIFEKEVDRCVENIKKPFAVNLITIAPNYKVQYEILQSKNVPFVVFAGSFPRKADIRGMKTSGKRTMSFASDESIAKLQIQFGVDSLILEGSEAGGHIGHVSLTILLQQVLFEFNEVPIFVGGGIGTGKMIAHLLAMGASGCQLGTRFVMTEECTAHKNFKDVFIKSKARHAISTPQYDSKLPVVAVRSIKNSGTDQFGKLQLELLKKLAKGELTREKAQYEVEKFWMGALREAVIEGDVEKGSLMAGQSVGLMREVLPMKDVVENMIKEAEDELQKIRERVG
ncbi:Enoyl-[acyl-carrier-protein] reductase [Chitinispirillum alkaliphilum]|nr:Enoyl-[acyl-carrier-protein] reductase [Chitinispirillum alkaliphilum]